MRKTEPLQVFQLEKHQGLSNPKLHWCCAGGTIHRWGLDSIKKIASCCRQSGATGSFYIPKTLQICILILHHHCIQYYNTKDQPFPAARMDVSFVHLLGQHICRSPTWPGCLWLADMTKDEKRICEGKKWLDLFFRKVTTECYRRLFSIIPWNSNRNVSNHGGLSATMISLAGGWRVWRAKDVAGRLTCSVHLPCLPPATSWTWQLARIVPLQWIRIEFICFSKIVIRFPFPRHLFLPTHLGARQERNASQGCSIESFSEHISQDTIFPANCCHGEVLRKTGRASQVLFLGWYPMVVVHVCWCECHISGLRNPNFKGQNDISSPPKRMTSWPCYTQGANPPMLVNFWINLLPATQRGEVM